MVIRNEALCALGKAGRIGLQIVRHFQEAILWVLLLASSLTSRNTNIVNADICFGY